MTQRTPTDWSGNISAETNLNAYDSATDTYDSTARTYDGVIATDLLDTDKQPTAWSPL